MSSTNRWYDRHRNDYYVTPQDHVRLFMKRFMQDQWRTHEDLEQKRIIDPCAGWDANNDMSYPAILFEQGANYYRTLTLDKREDSGSKYQWDFLEWPHRRTHRENWNTLWVCTPEIIISNPPFNLALDFIKKWLELVDDWGFVIYLLRLNFVWSKIRKSFFDKHMPKYIYVHHERMNFIPDSMKKEMKARGEKPPSWDSIEYAHFVFQKWYQWESSELFIL